MAPKFFSAFLSSPSLSLLLKRKGANRHCTAAVCLRYLSLHDRLPRTQTFLYSYFTFSFLNPASGTTSEQKRGWKRGWKRKSASSTKQGTCKQEKGCAAWAGQGSKGLGRLCRRAAYATETPRDNPHVAAHTLACPKALCGREQSRAQTSGQRTCVTIACASRRPLRAWAPATPGAALSRHVGPASRSQSH